LRRVGAYDCAGAFPRGCCRGWRPLVGGFPFRIQSAELLYIRVKLALLVQPDAPVNEFPDPFALSNGAKKTSIFILEI
jgi:hypothetical protein